jgi:hypothetical protein
MRKLRAGQRWSGEFVVRNRDGRVLTAAVTELPVLDQSGELVGVVGLSTDVTRSSRRFTTSAPTSPPSWTTVIGLFEDQALHDAQERLRPGERLVLYADGLLEARSPDGRFDPDLLEQTVRAAAGGTAEEVASAIEWAVLNFEGGQPRGDMALLVVRVPA